MNIFVLIFVFLNCQYILIESTCDYQVLSQILDFTEAYVQKAMNIIKHEENMQPGPKECAQIFKSGIRKSGIYRIWPSNWKIIGSFRVYCDMSTGGGGWTVIQRRGQYDNPQNYFYKSWNEYKVGFGDFQKEFWLGNERIFSLSNQGNYSLRIDFNDTNSETGFAHYNNFWIENEDSLYELHLSDYSGSVGDSFSYHNGMKFSTLDKDNDLTTDGCANLRKGGWWYKSCAESNLNGLNLLGYHAARGTGINWYKWKGANYSLPGVEMKIRPANF